MDFQDVLFPHTNGTGKDIIFNKKQLLQLISEIQSPLQRANAYRRMDALTAKLQQVLNRQRHSVDELCKQRQQVVEYADSVARCVEAEKKLLMLKIQLTEASLQSTIARVRGLFQLLTLEETLAETAPSANVDGMALLGGINWLNCFLIVLLVWFVPFQLPYFITKFHAMGLNAQSSPFY